MLKLLLPRRQLGNDTWNNLNGKHDELEFTRLNIVWVGTVLDEIFWMVIFWVVIILGANFPGGNCPVGIIRVAIFRMGVFLVPIMYRL